jgi:hypothetical protein
VATGRWDPPAGQPDSGSTSYHYSQTLVDFPHTEGAWWTPAAARGGMYAPGSRVPGLLCEVIKCADSCQISRLPSPINKAICSPPCLRCLKSWQRYERKSGRSPAPGPKSDRSPVPGLKSVGSPVPVLKSDRSLVPGLKSDTSPVPRAEE